MAAPVLIDIDQIKSVLPGIDAVSAIEEGFVAYSQGKVDVPPVGEMIFDDPPGDVHIKYGAIIGDDYYTIKLASLARLYATIPAAKNLLSTFPIVCSRKTLKTFWFSQPNSL